MVSYTSTVATNQQSQLLFLHWGKTLGPEYFPGAHQGQAVLCASCSTSWSLAARRLGWHKPSSFHPYTGAGVNSIFNVLRGDIVWGWGRRESAIKDTHIPKPSYFLYFSSMSPRWIIILVLMVGNKLQFFSRKAKWKCSAFFIYW